MILLKVSEFAALFVIAIADAALVRLRNFFAIAAISIAIFRNFFTLDSMAYSRACQ